MTRQQRMGAEVGQVAGKLANVLGCSVCGIGIAIDMVGKRWGEDPYDWQGKRFSHTCKLTRSNLDAKQRAAVGVIERDLEGWASTQRGGEYQAPIPDSRLPPERDDA